MLVDKFGSSGGGGVLADMIAHTDASEETAAQSDGLVIFTKSFTPTDLKSPGQVRTIKVSANIRANIGAGTFGFYLNDVLMSNVIAMDTTDRTYSWSFFIDNTNSIAKVEIKIITHQNNYYINSKQVTVGRVLAI